MIKAFRNDGNAFIVMGGLVDQFRMMRLPGECDGAAIAGIPITGSMFGGRYPGAIFGIPITGIPIFAIPITPGLQPGATNKGTPAGVLLCFVIAVVVLCCYPFLRDSSFAFFFFLGFRSLSL